MLKDQHSGSKLVAVFNGWEPPQISLLSFFTFLFGYNKALVKQRISHSVGLHPIVRPMGDFLAHLTFGRSDLRLGLVEYC
jgi:hypothetical protein